MEAISAPEVDDPSFLDWRTERARKLKQPRVAIFALHDATKDLCAPTQLRLPNCDKSTAA